MNTPVEYLPREIFIDRKIEALEKRVQMFEEHIVKIDKALNLLVTLSTTQQKCIDGLAKVMELINQQTAKL